MSRVEIPQKGPHIKDSTKYFHCVNAKILMLPMGKKAYFWYSFIIYFAIHSVPISPVEAWISVSVHIFKNSVLVTPSPLTCYSDIWNQQMDNKTYSQTFHTHRVSVVHIWLLLSAIDWIQSYTDKVEDRSFIVYTNVRCPWRPGSECVRHAFPSAHTGTGADTICTGGWLLCSWHSVRSNQDLCVTWLLRTVTMVCVCVCVALCLLTACYWQTPGFQHDLTATTVSERK